MKGSNLGFILVPLVVLLIATPVRTQTIPQMLADAKQSLGRNVEVETGPPPTVESIVQQADVIVRGIVGTPKAHLSEDQKDVYSEYTIQHPTILYPSSATQPGSRPGREISITFTQPGGIVAINGLTFSVSHKELEPLAPGIECLFLLKRDGGTYRIVGTYYGVFRIVGDSLTPLAKASGFADDLRGLKIADATARLLSARTKLR